ncbi:AAA family ATPase SEC18 [Aspergillus clavatus NRRL 1]|uniref:Vesicular-fusion protein SEC18 n=1 Tax=Aspergillus clavatus (strain ATCC 1007 / CBS 513.65 / DSM 816 / NCTC 3887 / NRRL 1 / QM 1276 / 107) TaxID=344612 RepID=A1CKZ5_ASPCL|nr:vesicular fusion ATPase, putative [Aspergillus clavatus NRRL 1]EAW09819.1 vesicular fusion ATPase, putative [Aspergillus clavatus NRRL 1]
MFNRNNLPSVPNPFSSRPSSRGNAGPGQGAPPLPQRDGYTTGQPPVGGAGYEKSSHQSDHDVQMTDANAYSRGYGTPSPRPGYSQMPPRNPGGGRSPDVSSQVWELRPAKSPDNTYTFGNLVAVSTKDFRPPRDGLDLLLLVNDLYVFTARPLDGFPPGHISMSDPQRTWAGVAFTDAVKAQIYNPFSQGGQAYLGAADIEIGFAGKKRVDTPYDQDDLSNAVIRTFENQIFAPGQKILMDHKSIPLLLTVKTVQRIGLTSEKAPAGRVETDPTARGILTRHTQITFFKDGRTGINMKSSNRRPAANAIITPDFKFEDMGIGGLDAEFSTIFRRAFASRIFPPGLVEKLGIQHVKGILLYGPPGTGKTLIARQIGKMLNAREPKVINGPEVLNKFVGQSEENIRKLFADAEKEYKEKGDDSGLHIIIFDELDAVCKQRGSGAAGGTGVGDSVVNQLLSKLDGVDQLNNILLIGMTNRKDMVDEALLRPGRLEVHMEISLPDEKGRTQILKIHTQKMRDNKVMDDDVDLAELALQTKNFSGAEIAGLVKSASSFAFSRHVKVGTMAGISEDVANMKVNRADFHHALDEVKPAFGVSEEELSSRIQYGIFHYSPMINEILKEGELFVKQVSNAESSPLFSVLLHGPTASGKTALAARIAIDSGFPFIKLISPEDMVGFSEMARVQHISRIFDNAYKSRTSVVVVDNIERIIDWVPIGPRFSNTILQTLMVFLRKQPTKGRRLLILATTTERAVLKQLDLYNSFNADIMVPNVMTYDELRYIMEQSGAFEDSEIDQALEEVGGLTEDKTIGVGVKKVLLGIETAKQDPDKVGRFVRVLNRAIEEERTFE